MSISLARKRTIAIVTVIDCLAVLLAAITTSLAAIAMRQSVRSLEDETDELSHFAGRVAHDMMGPLSSLGLSLELLARRTSGDPAAESTAQRGLSIVRRAGRMVEDLLAFSRAGARRDPHATANLKVALEEVVEGLRLEALAAGVELRLQPVDSYLVACSPGVLTSIASNLARNAIKHMGDSSIRRVDVRVVGIRRPATCRGGRHGARCPARAGRSHLRALRARKYPVVRGGPGPRHGEAAGRCAPRARGLPLRPGAGQRLLVRRPGVQRRRCRAPRGDDARGALGRLVSWRPLGHRQM